MKFGSNHEKHEANQNLILKLYQNADLRRTGKSYQIAAPYKELTKFKQQIEQEKSGFHHRPFEAMLKRAFIYRVTFFTIGFLFFFLTLFIQQQSINWLPYSYIFSNHETAKHVIVLFCLALSVAAFAVSLLISAEQEALHQFTSRSKKKLKRIYDKKMLEAKRLNDLFLIKELTHEYKEKIDKMGEVQENTKLLIRLILKIKDPRKLSRLLNEALLEANDQFHEILNRFNNK